MSSNIILGIDPGSQVLGYGVVDTVQNKPVCLHLGALKLTKTDDYYYRLRLIYEHVILLIQEYKPVEMALEAPFYGKNVQSMLKLGRAQGVAMSAALSCNIPIVEYAPKKVKMAITGNGSASKEQVSAMLIQMFKLKEIPQFFDATDGLAVAVCHYYEKRSVLGQMGKAKSWEDFIKKNPDRIK